MSIFYTNLYFVSVNTLVVVFLVKKIIWFWVDLPRLLLELIILINNYNGCFLGGQIFIVELAHRPRISFRIHALQKKCFFIYFYLVKIGVCPYFLIIIETFGQL